MLNTAMTAATAPSTTNNANALAIPGRLGADSSAWRCCDRLTMDRAWLPARRKFAVPSDTAAADYLACSSERPGDEIKNALMDMNEVWNRPATA